MGNGFWLSFEPSLIIFLQSKVTPFMQKIFEAITFLGDVYAMILIIGFLYWGYKKELGKNIGIYAVIALLISVSLNNIVRRNRPYIDHEDIKCLKPRTNDGDIYDLKVQGYSFPSGHATDSVSTYGVLAAVTKNKVFRIALLLLAFFIGLSRVILGVHYPTDVLAGWLISAIIIFLVSKIKNRNVKFFLIIMLGIIGCFFCNSDDYYSSLGLGFGFILGFIYEEKFVNFENTKNVFFMILRTLGGLALFVILDKVFKLPFSITFLESKTFLSFLVRTIRYTVCSFILMAIYPKCFSFFDKMFKKKTDATASK